MIFWIVVGPLLVLFLIVSLHDEWKVPPIRKPKEPAAPALWFQNIRDGKSLAALEYDKLRDWEERFNEARGLPRKLSDLDVLDYRDHALMLQFPDNWSAYDLEQELRSRVTTAKAKAVELNTGASITKNYTVRKYRATDGRQRYRRIEFTHHPEWSVEFTANEVKYLAILPRPFSLAAQSLTATIDVDWQELNLIPGGPVEHLDVLPQADLSAWLGPIARRVIGGDDVGRVYGR